MEKGKQVAAPTDNAEKGKEVAVGAEHAEKGKRVADAEGGNGSSGWGRPAIYSDVAPLKRKFETKAQIRRKKKKNLKNKLRRERKERKAKIYSPANVKTFRESDTDEESDGVCSDVEDRACKSRDVFKKLKAGDIPYLLGLGEYRCPWCFRKRMPKDYLGMLQHAAYYGAGSQKHQPHMKAKHAAYGVFLPKHLSQA